MLLVFTSELLLSRIELLSAVCCLGLWGVMFLFAVLAWRDWSVEDAGRLLGGGFGLLIPPQGGVLGNRTSALWVGDKHS